MTTYELDKFVGLDISKIGISETEMQFVTRDGQKIYLSVYGDCCSYSYFYDFYGVWNLIGNGPILSVEEVDLLPSDPGYHLEDNAGYVQIYGIRFTTKHQLWGPVSSTISFRNESNGYYGGWAEVSNTSPNKFVNIDSDCVDIPRFLDGRTDWEK